MVKDVAMRVVRLVGGRRQFGDRGGGWLVVEALVMIVSGERPRLVAGYYFTATAPGMY